MKRSAFFVFLLLAAACSRDEASESLTTGTDVEVPQVSDTITPGRTTPTPTATGTIAADTNVSPPSTALGVPSPAPGQPVPNTMTAPAVMASQGQQIYNQKCAGCHGPDGKKPQGAMVVLASPEVQSKPNDVLMAAMKKSLLHQGLALPDEQMAPVVAYIKTLK